MTSESLSQSAQTADSIRLKAAMAFTEAFARLVKISSYYPEGHTIFAQAVADFRAPLEMLSEQGQPVELLVGREGYRAAGIELPAPSGVAAEIRQLFFDLGLYRIAFHCAVSPGDVQRFVTSISKWKIQIGSAGKFAFFPRENLPPTIDVLEQEFTVGKGMAERGEGRANGRVYDGIGQICRTLVDSGYSRSEVLACRDFLLEAARGQQQTGVPAAGGLGWEEVIELMTGVLDRISTSRANGGSGEHTDLNTIAGIFEQVGQKEMKEAGRQAIDTLLGYFQRETISGQDSTFASDGRQESSGEKKDGSEMRISPSQAVEEKAAREAAASGTGAAGEEAARQLRSRIGDFVRRNSLPRDVLKKLALSDHSEELSILLQLFLLADKRDKLERLAHRICSLVGGTPGERERQVLLAGLVDIAQKRGFAGFYALTKGVLEAMHQNGGSLGLRFILKLYQRLGRKQQRVAWPFLVNEMLAAGTGEREIFIEAAAVAGGVELKEMVSMQPYLENLDVFSGKEAMAEEFFLAEHIHGYPLYAFLLTTSCGGKILGNVCERAGQKPQDDMMAALAAILEPENSRHSRLLQHYLQCRPAQEFPDSLKREAESVVAQYLLTVGEKTDAAGLARIIEASGSFAGRSFIPVLEKIVHEKKMGLVTLWPPLCRKAAATTLAVLKKELETGYYGAKTS